MKKVRYNLLDFEIDKLTNSIENAVSGDVFNTEIKLVSHLDLRLLKKEQWLFDWQKELRESSKSVFKLTISGNADNIQGLISIEDRLDHMFMHLIESAKFNKGKTKTYLGVPGNLVAFACKLSKEKGYGGVVSFFAKTKLIVHYKESLGAKVLFANQMLIDERNAEKLINKYFKQ